MQYDSGNDVEGGGGNEKNGGEGGKSSADALAAAGFKKSIVKKSISIKIKSGEQMEGSGGLPTSTSGSQLTDEQKQRQAISNKLKQLAKKQKEDPTTTTTTTTNKSSTENLTLQQQLQQHQQQQAQMNGAEKLRAQYNQYQNSLAANAPPPGALLNQPPPGLPPMGG